MAVPPENAVLSAPAHALSRSETYARPYGNEAPWNIPAQGIPDHPESALWVERLWRLSTASRPGNFNLGGFENCSYPVYLASEATGIFRVRLRHPDWGNLHGKEMPWNPSWRAASGPDAQAIVLDPATGREWNLWRVKLEGSSLVVDNGSLVEGDYRVKVDGFRPSRGCGIPYLAMLVRPEEMAAGAIRHALSMPIKNPNSNIFLLPATKTDGDRFGIPSGVPEGMRFVLKISDREIQEWLDHLPNGLSAATRNSARIIAVVLRDYGWIITDHSGGAFLQFESNETAGEKWKALGLEKHRIGDKEYPRDLLDGLLTQNRIRALVPSDRYATQPGNPPSGKAATVGGGSGPP